MIEGRVLASSEVVVTLMVRGPTGLTARVQAMVDTGFNDQITLPPWVIERLALPFEEMALYLLAGGEPSQTRLFSGELEWHGAWRPVVVLEVEGDGLLGMEALKGCSLYVEVADGGRVEIQPLTTPGRQ